MRGIELMDLSTKSRVSDSHFLRIRIRATDFMRIRNRILGVSGGGVKGNNENFISISIYRTLSYN